MIDQVRRLLSLPDTPRYNIKAVVQQTQLNISTLRAWEQRYGLPSPKRSEHGHRLYSERDIATIKWLKHATESGLAISQAVAALRDADKPAAPPPEVAPAPVQQVSWAGLRKDLLDALLNFNLRQAHLIVNTICTLYSIDTVILELFEPMLVSVGESWSRGEICVAEERLATSFVRQRLLGLIQLHAPFTNGPRIVCLCPPEEQHEIGLLMFALLMEQRGWEVIYLGQTVMLEGLTDFLGRVAPALVCTSTTMIEHVRGLKEIGEIVETMRDQGLMLIFGGRIFQIYADLCERVPGTFLGNDLREAVEHADALGEIIDREAWLSMSAVKYRTNGIAHITVNTTRAVGR